MKNYLVLSLKEWNWDNFDRYFGDKNNWYLVKSLEQLRLLAARLNPRYIFVPHWSEMLPKDIYGNYECVVFHMTDLPYGRGGSPLQNLIEQGHKTTWLSSFRVTGKLDAGDIYSKVWFSLDGKAEDIFKDCSNLCFKMMETIAAYELEPTPQAGKPTYFMRRTPDMSRLPDVDDVNKLYDHIRMLDAPTYPKAFLDWNEWRLEFTDVSLGDGLNAKVRFIKDE